MAQATITLDTTAEHDPMIASDVPAVDGLQGESLLLPRPWIRPAGERVEHGGDLAYDRYVSPGNTLYLRGIVRVPGRGVVRLPYWHQVVTLPECG